MGMYTASNKFLKHVHPQDVQRGLKSFRVDYLQNNVVEYISTTCR